MAFPKIGTTKYVVSIVQEKGSASHNYGPFVVRSTSRQAAIAYVKRTWPVSWAKGFEVCVPRRPFPSV